MNIIPVITEKSTALAKKGKYTFKVEKGMTKPEIKGLISKIFGVKVKGIRTIKIGGEIKSTTSRRKKVIKPVKKAIVWLSGKDKIDLFESKK